ncbi:unnamed protein product, partial [Iphiclides podalirius]
MKTRSSADKAALNQRQSRARQARPNVDWAGGEGAGAGERERSTAARSQCAPAQVRHSTSARPRLHTDITRPLSQTNTSTT